MEKILFCQAEQVNSILQYMKPQMLLRSWLTAGILEVLLIWGSLPIIQAQDQLRPKRQGEPFILPTWDGKVLKSSQLKGQVILLEFFQTGCPDCQEEAPELERLYQQYRKRGFMVVGISHDRAGAKVVGPFVSKYNLTYPVVIGDLSIAVNYIGITPSNPSFRIPYLVLIDRKGFIVGQFEQGKDKEATDLKLLKALIKKLL
jgi:peroxiredoxin